MKEELDGHLLEALRSVDRARPMTPEGRDRARSRALEAFDLPTEDRRDDGPTDFAELVTVDPSDGSSGREPRRPQLRLVAAALLVVALIGAAAWFRATDAGDVTGVDVADGVLDQEFVLGQQPGDAVLAADVEAWCSATIDDLRVAVAGWRGSPTDAGATDELLLVLSEVVSDYGDVIRESASPIGPQRLNEVANFGGRLALVRQDVTVPDDPRVEEVQALLDEFGAELDAVADDAHGCEFLR